VKWFAELLLGGLTSFLTPIFNWLNTRVDADARKHISDNATIAGTVGAVVGAQANADALNTQVRLKEGKWSPWVIVTVAGFMVPFAWHTWQVCLDSSRWVIEFGPWYIPRVVEHTVGSWKVAALPGLWETTEHAVIQSLFTGAGVAVGAIPIIKALRR
jgi:hypothetical protein